MPAEATSWMPVSSATRDMKRMSRPASITVGSQIVLTPRSIAARTCFSARSYSFASS
jgi:hypothetical protein